MKGILKDKQGEPRIWWSWQNLNGRPKGSGWRHGRAWLHVKEATGRVEWGFGKQSSYGAALNLRGYDDDLGGHICVPLVGLYWGLDWWVLNKRMPENGCFSISWHGGRLWVSLGDDCCGNNRLPKWRRFSWSPANTLLGKGKFSKELLREERVTIPLPEGAVQGTVTFSLFTWKRPRWPFPRRSLSAEITPDRAAVIPGKGENSWDMDDDAIFSLSCNATTAEDAIVAYVKAVLRDRRRHGGSVNWQPSGVTE